MDRFRVIATPRGHHKGPEAVLVDGSKVAFSYQTEIQLQVNTYYENRKASHTLMSDESGQDLAPADVRVSYFRGPRFHDIAMEFVQAADGFDAVDLTADTARGLALFTDRALAECWHAHHQKHAVLGLLSAKENLRRPRM